MKILIVNDDSIHAPGIAMLAKAAMEFGEVTVVAPAHQCSAMSQKLTIHGTMMLKKAEDFPVPVKAAWQLEGTPVDCVKVALQTILQEKPDYVFSGINNGYNAGYDIAFSGTLGAAFEAVRNGIPAIAFSSAAESRLAVAEPYLVPVIRDLLEKQLPPGEVWNVNFPFMKTGEAKGILWDRPVAPVQLYTEKYIEERLPDGSSRLTCQGMPTPSDAFPEGTDADGVKRGYICVSRIKGMAY